MIEIFPLSEGAFTIDGSKEFVPFEKGSDELNERPTGSLLVEIQPFLVKSGKNLVLFDTGLGKKLANGELQIHQNIREAGLDPSSVTHVMLSHLHKDHAGGLGHTDGSKQLNFPNAKHFIHRKEWNWALEKGLPSYDPDDFSFLSSSPQLVYLEEDRGIIDGMDVPLEYEIVGGHCPFHLALKMHEAGRIVFYGGDVAPQLGQMRRRVNAKYDYDGKRSMELRDQWWETGQKEHWTFLFYHDIKTPVKVA